MRAKQVYNPVNCRKKTCTLFTGLWRSTMGKIVLQFLSISWPASSGHNQNLGYGFSYTNLPVDDKQTTRTAVHTQHEACSYILTAGYRWCTSRQAIFPDVYLWVFLSSRKEYIQCSGYILSFQALISLHASSILA